MYWSKYFIPTLKEAPAGTEAISHQLLLRAGLVHMLTAGVYTYLPLGYRVLKNVERVIRQEMNAAGAAELFMPCLHPLELWKQTGRDEVLKDVMIRFKDGRGREMCLGPTHEEVVTDLVKNFVQSYRQLPVILYQIQTKFRDEMRARFGIVRACEFIMKDAYSFDRDAAGLQKNYARMETAYRNIFKRLDLDVVVVAADSGAMGGKVSHEFMVPAEIGEDAVAVCGSCAFRGGASVLETAGGVCPQCGQKNLAKSPALELGHIFQLGVKYSAAQQALFLDEKGERQPIIMGCYGIGVSRVVAAIIEKHHDEKGIIWPKAAAPFDVEILTLPGPDDAEGVEPAARELYRALTEWGMDVLVDDRPDSPGRKFNDADLIGIPLRVTIGRKNMAQGQIEIKVRGTGAMVLVPQQEAGGRIKEMIAKL
ncbi:MAG: proline--tRNA ligase [Candidatus Omnitrophica bacterium]|nr:proline--tRNA ligase [Candidatus Omnitrophota bacterium]